MPAHKCTIRQREAGLLVEVLDDLNWIARVDRGGDLRQQLFGCTGCHLDIRFIGVQLFDGYRTSLFDRVRTMRKSQELRTDGMSVLQALADPVRLEIVRQLAGSRRGELVCGELAVPVTKSTASHHIRT